MRNIVEVVGLEELGGDDPWTVLNDLVHPLAVSHRFSSLLGRHDGQALALVCLVVTGNTDNKSGVGEGLFGLLKLSHVPAKPVVSLVVPLPGTQQHRPYGCALKVKLDVE